MPAARWILVVDDDLVSSAAVCDYLESHGFSATTAPDAQQAVIQAEVLNPCMVIMDMQMRAFGSGADAVRAMRAIPQLSRIPVLILTGMDLKKAAELLPQDSLVRLMAKPPNWPAMLATIESMVPAATRPPTSPPAPAGGTPAPTTATGGAATQPPTAATGPSPFRFPAPPGPGEAPAQPPQGTAPPAESGPDLRAKPGTRILAIDDEADWLQLISMGLQLYGYTVMTAADGRKGLELARKSPPDLLLCDLMMPGLTGMEVLRALPADPALSRVPVIIMTGAAMDPQTRALFMRQPNFRQWLPKPFDPLALAGVIKAVLSGVTAAPPAAAKPRGTTKRTFKVLILEDDQKSLQLLGLLFEPEDTIMSAANGIDALAFLKANPVSLVLSEMFMPGLNSMEIMRVLAKDPMLGSIPFVLVTGTRLSERDARVVRAECPNLRFIFQKPIDADQVRNALDSILVRDMT